MIRNIQTKEDTMARSDADARHQLAEAFRGYLTRERGLAHGTVDNYSHGAALFLARLPDPLDEALREMPAGRVLEIIGELVRPGGPSARSLSVPLRALLRFLHVTPGGGDRYQREPREPAGPARAGRERVRHRSVFGGLINCRNGPRISPDQGRAVGFWKTVGRSDSTFAPPQWVEASDRM
jgi:hypothetical protein